MRMAEDEIVVSAVDRACVERVELGAYAVGEWHRSGRPLRFRRTELPANVTLAHAQATREPVDIPPPQAQKLALPQPGHRGRQVERALERSEVVVRDGAQQRLELRIVEEADFAV